MIKSVVIALALLASTVSVQAADQKLQDVLAATAQLNKNCSATVIKSKRDEKTGKVETVLITAKHCVDGAGDGEQLIEFPIYKGTHRVGNRDFVGKVKGQSYKVDLALIKLADEDTLFEKVSKLAPAELNAAIGDPVVTVGYPFGLSLTVTNGAFGQTEVIDYPKVGSEYYRATPMIAGGNSGGAMYLKLENGDYILAGVTTAAIGGQGGGFAGFYTPSYMIHDYLQTALSDVAEKKVDLKVPPISPTGK
jgi:S1-C subfamily serine protease